MSDFPGKPNLRLRVIAVSIAGALAIVCFLVSLLLTGAPADVLRTIAGVAAFVCALIGISFAFVGGKR